MCVWFHPLSGSEGGDRHTHTHAPSLHLNTPPPWTQVSPQENCGTGRGRTNVHMLTSAAGQKQRSLPPRLLRWTFMQPQREQRNNVVMQPQQKNQGRVWNLRGGRERRTDGQMGGHGRTYHLSFSSGWLKGTRENTSETRLTLVYLHLCEDASSMRTRRHHRAAVGKSTSPSLLPGGRRQRWRVAVTFTFDFQGKLWSC